MYSKTYFMSMELVELYDRRRAIENRIDSYFGGDTVYTGDRGYQELLEELSEIDTEIEYLQKSED